MKNLFYLFLAVTIFSCSSDGDEDCREIVGMGYSCIGLDCTYSIDLYSTTYTEGEPILVNETTYFYYEELWDENEIVCWEGEQ
jgi:hypothetical protein